jgi:hypothetical protein
LWHYRGFLGLLFACLMLAGVGALVWLLVTGLSVVLIAGLLRMVYELLLPGVGFD